MSEPPPDYDPGAFPPFAVTVDIVVFTIVDDALQVLLVERGEDPFRGTWALPGGFVRPREDLHEAAARELAEETTVTGEPGWLEQLGTYGRPDRDPRMRVVTVAFWAICADLHVPRAGGDAAAAELVPVSKVEGGLLRLAFDHGDIVRAALERLRARVADTPLATRFCPPEFTITQLRRAHEAVWDTDLDAGNFQRWIRQSAWLEDAGRRRPPSPAGGRPASVWRPRDDIGLPEEPVAAAAELSPALVRAEPPGRRRRLPRRRRIVREWDE